MELKKLDNFVKVNKAMTDAIGIDANVGSMLIDLSIGDEFYNNVMAITCPVGTKVDEAFCTTILKDQAEKIGKTHNIDIGNKPLRLWALVYFHNEVPSDISALASGNISMDKAMRLLKKAQFLFKDEDYEKEYANPF